MEHISRAAGHESLFVHAIQTINKNQKKRFVDKIEAKRFPPGTLQAALVAMRLARKDGDLFKDTDVGRNFLTTPSPTGNRRPSAGTTARGTATTSTARSGWTSLARTGSG